MELKRQKMVEKCYSPLFWRSPKDDIMDAIDFDEALGNYINNENDHEMDIDIGPC